MSNPEKRGATMMSEKPTYEELKQRISVLQSKNSKYRQTLKKLYHDRVKYQSFFNNAADVILITDMNGNLLEANSVFGVKSGYPTGQLFGRNIITSEILTEASSALAKRMLKEIVEGKNSISFEIHTRRKGGQIVPYEAKATPIKRKNTVVAAQFILRNISSRKKMESALVDEVAKLRKKLAAKVLHGFIPICSICKKIRDEKGLWTQIEAYIHKHFEIEFSHGICPECAKKYYADFSLYED